jgi:D-alanyl-D-alanine carboxypeptidase
MLTNKYEVRFFAALSVILTLFLIVTYKIGHQELAKETAKSAAIAASPFEKLTISAKSAYVLDAKTGKVLYEKNSNVRLPLASLVKVMTALVATDIAPSYSTVTISLDAVQTSGDSGLRVGERWLLRDLVDFTLISSSNDGARAIAMSLGSLASSTSSNADAEADFIHKMNTEADKLGMKDTYFLNDTGLDLTQSQGGAYGTAKDIATLFNYILKSDPALLAATRSPSLTIYSLDKIPHLAMNTDTIVGNLPGLIGSKTGYTDLAGGNLVVALDPELGHPIVISVLGSSETGRFEDMQKLVSAALASIQITATSVK